jgi:membrane-associated phospholipid phosphatase
VEWVVILYLALTGILIALCRSQLQNVNFHLLFRFLIITIFAGIAFSGYKFGNQKLFHAGRQLFPFLLLGFLYKETDYLNNLVFRTDLDHIFAQFDVFIFGFQPSLVFSQIIPSGFFAELMYFGYFSYYLMVIIIPVYLYFKRSRQIGEQAVFVIICSFILYYLIFIIVPVAGPQFYFVDNPGKLPEGFVFGNILRIIQHFGEGRTAAFPSSHVSICLMIVWACFKSAGRLLWIIIPIAILLILSTIYIRAHYVVDILGAFLFTPMIYLISNRIYRMFSILINDKPTG